ncbi:hypothetical protein M5689_023672 [Euphorbia peplus]|nr:hypothetical protein M5689_023672 [Euphorbia peplus]
MSGKLLQDEEMHDSSEQTADESSQFQQLYIVVAHYPSRGLADIAVYRIDVTNNSNTAIIPSVEPILYLDDDDFKFPAFAVLEHTLYMFGGVHSLSYDKEISGLYWGNEVRKYDLKTTCSTKLKTSSLPLEISRMTGRKMHLEAVVIDDTRICVFATLLHDGCIPNYYDPPSFAPPNFELFDTVTETWKPLPEPMEYHENVHIASYFTGPSTFTIYTNPGLYQIKFDVPDPTWQKLDINPPLPLNFRISTYHGIFIDHKPNPLVLINPFTVIRWSDFERPYPCELKSDQGRKPLTMCPSSAGFCSKDGLIYVVRIGVDDWNCFSPHLLVDTYKNDSKFESNLTESKEIEPVNSFTAALTSLSNCRIRIIGCFLVKNQKRTRNAVIRHLEKRLRCT